MSISAKYPESVFNSIDFCVMGNWTAARLAAVILAREISSGATKLLNLTSTAKQGLVLVTLWVYGVNGDQQPATKFESPTALCGATQ